MKSIFATTSRKTHLLFLQYVSFLSSYPFRLIRLSDFHQIWFYTKMSFGISSGVGVTKLISSVPLFSDFFLALSKHTLDIEYHGNVWQVSPQLSCDSKNLRGVFACSKILLTEKLTNRALVTPTPDHIS